MSNTRECHRIASGKDKTLMRYHRAYKRHTNVTKQFWVYISWWAPTVKIPRLLLLIERACNRESRTWRSHHWYCTQLAEERSEPMRNSQQSKYGILNVYYLLLLFATTHRGTPRLAVAITQTKSHRSRVDINLSRTSSDNFDFRRHEFNLVLQETCPAEDLAKKTIC